MITKDIPYNRDILKWARETANLSRSIAASKAKINDLKSRGGREAVSSETRLERWEQGADKPTFSQLEKLAKAYRRPVLTFFLQDAPIQKSSLQDFRTIANKEIETVAYGSEFSAFTRQIEALHVTIRDLLIDSGNKELSFVGSLDINSSPLESAKTIRDLLKYPIVTQRRAHGSDQLFSDIRQHAEELGIYIILEGNLGSWHTDFEPDVFRGISISDRIAPLIVVNPNDAKTARVFTLLHELCHIFLGDNGIYNWSNFNIRQASRYENEQFCDKVAAEFLVPKDYMVIEWNNFTTESTKTRIEQVARKYNVSRIVVARRMFDLDYIDSDYYWEYYEESRTEWEQIKDKVRSKKEHPSYAIRTRTRLGEKLINTVVLASREGRISELQASRILNVKINNLSKIL